MTGPSQLQPGVLTSAFAAAMHVAIVNYFYDRAIATPTDLLQRYSTLTGVAEGLTRAGATVSVVQRFDRDAEVLWRDVAYRFVEEPVARPGSLVDRAGATTRAVTALRPDLIHVNGLHFARQAQQFKRVLSHVPLVIQDHAGAVPGGIIQRWSLAGALRTVDAVAFSARAQAEPWVATGVLSSEASILEIMEGSSPFRLLPRSTARLRTRLAGDPLCLWVGRLDANKDPLTVLQGFKVASRRLPDARLAMAYGDDTLLRDVRDWLTANPLIALRVLLLGCVSHSALEVVYNSSDLFVVGSHHEGSGYAVLEALSCGVAPVVTDIPSYRVLTDRGAYGALWTPGDAAALAECLVEQYARVGPHARTVLRAHFDRSFSFDAIGRRMHAEYARLCGLPVGAAAERPS